MYSNVIVPLDGSPFAEQAIGPAVSLAARSHAGLLLLGVHDTAPSTQYRSAEWEEFRRCEQEVYIEALAARVQSTFSGTVDWTVIDGHVVDAICARAESLRAPLVVMSTHGRTGISRAWLGSVATGVVRQSSAPVLMVRPPAASKLSDAGVPPFANVIAALDGSDYAEQLLPHAAGIACASDARLLLLRIVSPAESGGIAFANAGAYLDGVARRWSGVCRAVDFRVEAHSSPAAAILERANMLERPLIALASHGRGLSSLFLGSVADEVLRASADAVLMVRRTM